MATNHHTQTCFICRNGLATRHLAWSGTQEPDIRNVWLLCKRCAQYIDSLADLGDVVLMDYDYYPKR